MSDRVTEQQKHQYWMKKFDKMERKSANKADVYLQRGKFYWLPYHREYYKEYYIIEDRTLAVMENGTPKQIAQAKALAKKELKALAKLDDKYSEYA